MLKDKDILLAIREVVVGNGFGTMIAVYNDIEQKWYYYCGDFKPKNPSNNIHFNSIRGKCLNYIVDNQQTYFSGTLVKSELVSTKIDSTPDEMIEFDFKFVWIK